MVPQDISGAANKQARPRMRSNVPCGAQDWPSGSQSTHAGLDMMGFLLSKWQQAGELRKYGFQLSSEGLFGDTASRFHLTEYQPTSTRTMREFKPFQPPQFSSCANFTKLLGPTFVGLSLYCVLPFPSSIALANKPLSYNSGM